VQGILQIQYRYIHKGVIMLKIKHLIIVLSLVLASFAMYATEKSSQFYALGDALVIQPFVDHSQVTNATQNPIKEKTTREDCTNQSQSCTKEQKQTKRKRISWGKWLFTFHKTPSLHFLDLLELISH